MSYKNTLWLKMFLAIGFCLCSVASTVYGQEEDRCPNFTYADKGQITPDYIKVSGVSGRVFYRPLKGEIEPTSFVCVGLFDERSRRLVAKTTVDDDGWFRFRRKVPKGKYRLVVKDFHHVLCPANVPVQIDSRVTPKRRIAVYMVTPSIDVCSYGEIM